MIVITGLFTFQRPGFKIGVAILSFCYTSSDQIISKYKASECQITNSIAYFIFITGKLLLLDHYIR